MAREGERPAVQVRNLHKRYKDVKAVDGVSFEVYHGEVFCLVGPNGAGKTTTIECAQGLRVPDEGTVSVMGLDPQTSAKKLSFLVGSQLQESQLQNNIKVWEVLDLYASFYPYPADWGLLLERLNLSEKYNARYDRLSGGQKQRLKVALALVNDPQVIFLDELTTGLDPRARRAIWDLVLDIKNQGRTVVLTTHYMEEAEKLSDRVAIMNQGRLEISGSPRDLIEGLGQETKVEITTQNPIPAGLLESLPHVDTVTYRVFETGGHGASVKGTSQDLVVSLVNALHKAGAVITSLKLHEPTLEDVFLAFCGERGAMG